MYFSNGQDEDFYFVFLVVEISVGTCVSILISGMLQCTYFLHKLFSLKPSFFLFLTLIMVRQHRVHKADSCMVTDILLLVSYFSVHSYI
jgi:uncharacterized membrane protein (GlpM family)